MPSAHNINGCALAKAQPKESHMSPSNVKIKANKKRNWKKNILPTHSTCQRERERIHSTINIIKTHLSFHATSDMTQPNEGLFFPAIQHMLSMLSIFIASFIFLCHHAQHIKIRTTYKFPNTSYIERTPTHYINIYTHLDMSFIHSFIDTRLNQRFSPFSLPVYLPVTFPKDGPILILLKYATLFLDCIVSS